MKTQNELVSGVEGQSSQDQSGGNAQSYRERDPTYYLEAIATMRSCESPLRDFGHVFEDRHGFEI